MDIKVIFSQERDKAVFKQEQIYKNVSSILFEEGYIMILYGVSQIVYIEQKEIQQIGIVGFELIKYIEQEEKEKYSTRYAVFPR